MKVYFNFGQFTQVCDLTAQQAATLHTFLETMDVPSTQVSTTDVLKMYSTCLTATDAEEIRQLTRDNLHTEARLMVAAKYPVSDMTAAHLQTIKDRAEERGCMTLEDCNERYDVTKEMLEQIAAKFGTAERKLVEALF